MKKAAQDERILMEKAEGTADRQKDLAKSVVNIDIKRNDATARKEEADGESTYIEKTGRAKGAEVEAVGMAKAKAFKEQVDALGPDMTALVNILTAMSENGIKIMPDTVVIGGSSLEGLSTAAMNLFQGMVKEQGPKEKKVIRKKSSLTKDAPEEK